MALKTSVNEAELFLVNTVVVGTRGHRRVVSHKEYRT